MTGTTTTTNNNHDRFVQLLEQHQPVILKVARTYCWHPDDRAELSQEIVTQLWRAFKRYDASRKFSTWMYRIALNVAISFVRSNSLRQRHFVALDESTNEIAAPDSCGSQADELEADERVEFLYHFINQLDALNRALLLLYMEERSHAEIADILGITATNVATKINRLKQRIRQLSDDSTHPRNQTNDRSNQHGT